MPAPQPRLRLHGRDESRPHEQKGAAGMEARFSEARGPMAASLAQAGPVASERRPSTYSPPLILFLNL